MSSSDRITRGKGEPAGLSLPTKTWQRRKSPIREAEQVMEQSGG